MSIFTKIENAEHSTVAWLEKELTAFEGKAPKIEAVIDAGLMYIGPVLEIGLQALNQDALAADVAAIISAAKTKLAAASAVVADFGPTPTAASMFTAVQSDLGSILTTVGVKNATTVATVTKAVNEVGILGAAVSTAAAAIATAAAPAPAAAPAA